MEAFIRDFFQFGGGFQGWRSLSVCGVLFFLLAYWYTRKEDVFLIGIFAYAVLFFGALLKCFRANKRGRVFPIDWALFNAMIEFVYLALFFYFSSRRARKKEEALEAKAKAERGVITA